MLPHGNRLGLVVAGVGNFGELQPQGQYITYTIDESVYAIRYNRGHGVVSRLTATGNVSMVERGADETVATRLVLEEAVVVFPILAVQIVELRRCVGERRLEYRLEGL